MRESLKPVFLEGLVEGRMVNGTMSEAYEFDNDGDYMSMITVSGGKARIAFDPAKRPSGDKAAHFSFGTPHSASADVTRILTALRHADEAVDQEARAKLVAMKNIPGTPNQVWVQYSFVDLRRSMLELAHQTRHTLVRRMALMAYLARGDNSAPEDRARAEKILTEVTPTDPLWSMLKAIVGVLGAVDDERLRVAYETEFVEHHPDNTMVSEYLLNQLLLNRDDPAKREPLVTRLKDKRFEGTPAAKMGALFDPNRPAAAGKPVPHFEVPSLDGKTTFSPDAFKGQVYLLELWATWCAPCVAEMPGVEAAWKAFGEKSGTQKPLRILSISMDQEAEEVAKFRRDRFPMPWDHGIAGPEGHARIGAAFGAAGIPFYALIGEDGKIIASSPDLTGASIVPILESVLK